MSEESKDNLELMVWRGDWGLPSVDHHCLAAMAYCKFSEAPLKISKTCNPWKGTLNGSLATLLRHDLTNGFLPVLNHDNEKDSEVADILAFLRKQGWGTDHTLTSKQSADIVAYTAMVEDKLLPALLHLWWVDNRTYSELTLPWYAKTLPFPLGMYLPRRTHKECVTRLQHSKGGEALSSEDIELKILKDAKECLNLLSSKLSDQDYFFGSRPSSLDAIVFGYLAPLLKAPFPSTSLQNHLRACSNLCQFCQRILSTYFPLSPQEIEEQKKAEQKRSQEVGDPDFPNKRRDMFLAGTVALTAMVGYAFMSGLVDLSVKVVDEEKEWGGAVPKPPDLSQFDNFASGDNGNGGEGGKGGQGSK